MHLQQWLTRWDQDVLRGATAEKKGRDVNVRIFRPRAGPLLGSTAIAFALSATLAWAAQPQAGAVQPVEAPPPSAPRPPAAVDVPEQAAPGEVAPTPALRPRAIDVQLTDSQIATLRQALADAGAHGLKARNYDVGDIDAALNGPEELRREAVGRLIEASLRYARAVHSGQLPEDKFMKNWGMRPEPYDPAPPFIQAVRQDRLTSWLGSLAPPYTGYEDLQKGLVTYRQIAERGGWKPVPEGPDLKLGSSDARVIALRRRLAAEDPRLTADGGPVFDEALKEAVVRAQKRYGLNPTGVVSKGTLASLNVPVKRRIEQIQANMERWRWMPQSLPADRVQVNIAAAVLTVFNGDEPTMSMRAVTGRPGDETPMLVSRIHSIVFNPPWNVPSSIATKELWPKERAHPGYFAANDFIVIPTGDGGNRLQQKAGPKAALGRVKFDFSNPYGVYLHDTPSRSKFDSYSRLASHGCVRLQRPVVLAKALLKGDETWTAEAVDAALTDEKTVRAQLPSQMTVLLFYWTAYVAPDGAVNFRNDPYGWDTELVQRIAAGAGSTA
jgi:murein L,D-transpeptidase YcbB/YkuD